MKQISKICWWINICCILVLLPQFLGVAHSQPLAEKKYSSIIWDYLSTLSGFGPRYVGTRGYENTLDLIRQVGLEFADDVLEHPFVIKRHNGEKLKMRMYNDCNSLI